MKILVLGASGLVGGNCLKLFREKKGWEVMGTHFSFATEHTQFFNTLNVEDPKNFDIEEFAPDVILHAGALTHVDYCEENPEESYEKTVKSTQNVAKLVKKFNSKFVYISTDYVFDGKNGPYAEDAETNPLSIYGKHKLEAENIVRQAIDHLVVRVTTVYGDEIRNKNFIARILDAIKGEKELELNLPIDQYATPANAFDIARMLQVLLENNERGVFHVASTDFLNRVQLTQRVCGYFDHHKISIIPTATSELNQPAERPLYGGLKAAKFLQKYPHFKFTNIDDYLKSYS